MRALAILTVLPLVSDSTRLGAKCPAATDQSELRGWDCWTARKQERTCREVS